MTPILHTDRLVLSAFSEADAPDVFAYASNPNVARHTTWETHRSLADAEAFVARVLARGPDEPTWAIRLRDAPTVIGAIEFGPVGDGTVAEIHYVLAEPFWNRGLMTEAARAVLAWGWSAFPKVRRVRTYATVENVGSRRVMEKLGMAHVATTFHRWAKCAESVEQVEYAIERDA